MRKWIQKFDALLDRHFVSMTILYVWIVLLGMVFIFTLYTGMGYD